MVSEVCIPTQERGDEFTDNMIAKYSVLNESKQRFASKYLPYLPTEKELVAEIEREKRLIEGDVSR